MNSAWMVRTVALGALLTLGCTAATSVVGGATPDGASPVDVVVDVTASDLASAPDVPAVDVVAAPDVVTATDVAPTDGPLAGCRADNDCLGNEFGFGVCDVTNRRCVQCLPARDTCAPGTYCDDRSLLCVRGCHSDEGCHGGSSDAGVTSSTPVCNTMTHTCVGCTTDAHCPAGMVCMGEVCVSGCSAGTRCPDGQMCCAGGCVDTQANASNCGACGNRCAVAHGGASCEGGRCLVGSCTGAYRDCDNNVSTGCESDTLTDLANCGGCGRPCPTPAHATPTCSGGRCGFTCAEGFADCNMDPADGCETDLNRSAESCGMCGRACVVAHGTGSCVMGRCAAGTCADGYGDCNLDATDGCETATGSSVMHCGSCGRACPTPPHGTASCAMGRCGVGACDEGFGDCDLDPANGCETDLRATAAHCGMCGNRCALASATAACSGGRCVVAACDPGYADCDANPANGCEVNVNTSVAHCGMCGHTCPTPTSGMPACVMGVCGVGSCAEGRADCNMSPGDGCEVDTNTSVTSCGACGRTCSVANGSAACAMGRCVIAACNAGYADCDGLPANGCETNVGADVTNCGRCGVRCVAPVGGSAACMAGVCSGACPSGQSNCGGTCRATGGSCTSAGSGGCEATGALVCSGTTTACNATPRTSGACATPSGGSCDATGACVCPAGRTSCGGACVDTTSDANNCGACGRVCGAGFACAAGVCVGTGQLRFTLTWSLSGDMDLHVTPPCGTEIVYYNRTACGGTLDRDDTSTVGPENIFWTTGAARGSYRICISPYSIRGATSWTLQIYNGTTLVRTDRGTSTSSLGQGCSTVLSYTF